MTQDWRNDPPTYRQWMDAKSDGYWWIKTQITISESEEDGIVFPEFSLYDIVCITFSPDPEAGLMSRTGRLSFMNGKDRIYCDDLSGRYPNVQWQAVLPHSDPTS